MIQFTTIFSPKYLKLILLQLHMERKLHKCLVNFKAATVTEKAVYTSHLGQKKRGGIWLKKSMLFFSKIFFFLVMQCRVFRVHQNAFQREKWCFIISRCFAVSYSWRYIFVYPLYTWNLLVFSSLVLKNNAHITYRFCEIKATLIVGEEVTKGEFVNLCTPFCSLNPLNASVALI